MECITIASHGNDLFVRGGYFELTSMLEDVSVEDLLNRISIHEAGHALTAHLLGLTIIQIKCEIGPHGSNTETRAQVPESQVPNALRKQIMVAYAGFNGERIIFGDEKVQGSQGDVAKAVRHARTLVSLGGIDEAEIKSELIRLRNEGFDLLNTPENRNHLQQIAEGLKLRKQMSHQDLIDMLSE